jgi:hypothetical protein
MTESAGVTSEQTAALVAPIIDRLRLAIMRATVGRSADIQAAVGLSQDGARTFAMLRHTMPDRIVARSGLVEVFRYVPADAVERGIADVLHCGLVDAVDDDALRLTAEGRNVGAQLFERSDAATGELWAGHEATAARLAGLAERCVDAAGPTGGRAFAVLVPQYEPAGASAIRLLAERLTALRFHRFDAHVAAWEAAGLTAAEAQRLTDGPEREAIEASTNQRAAAPYDAISAVERLELIAGLGALPG